MTAAWQQGPPAGWDEDVVDLTPPAGRTPPAPAKASTVRVLDGPAIAVPIPRVDCLVSEIGLVAGAGAPHLVAGYGYAGKSLALQSLALSLAAGRAVWGVYTSRQSRVIHVDLEQGDQLTRRRYQRLAAAMGIDLSTLGDALGVVIMPGLSLTRAHRAQWLELMTGRDLMIVDSLRAASRGLDENSSEIRACLDLIGELSEATGCRVIIIHHSRKPQKDDPGGRFAIRGSSSIYDACDCVYLFAAPKGEPISVEQAKARTQGDSIPDFALVITDVDVDGDPRGGLRVQVHGHELVEERRQERTEAAYRAQAGRDALRVHQAVAATPGIAYEVLRGTTRLSGDRLAAAIHAMGDAIETRIVPEGRTRLRRHYLRGAS